MGKLGARAVDKRMRFVTAAETREETMTALCRRFGLSRKTGYKWLERYRLGGLAGLSERSRAPHAHPQAVSAAIAERCLAVRRAHRSWGPVKVRAWLERDDPATPWPAASTIGELFDREGLTVKRKLRRRCPPSSAPFAACGDANTVWCIDFKGWFLTGDGTHCEPLTLSDAYCRYLLRCQPLGRTDSEHVWPVLDAAFWNLVCRCGCARTTDRHLRRPAPADCRGWRSRSSRRGSGRSASPPANRSRTVGSNGCI